MNNRGRTTIWLLGLGLAVALSLGAAPDRTAHAADTSAKTTAKLAQARVDSAAKAYAAFEALQQTGRTTPDVVYLWSVRWFQAQRDLPLKGKALAAAANDHLTRMMALEAAVAQQFKAGTATNADMAAATYFRDEAELWNARGGR